MEENINESPKLLCGLGNDNSGRVGSCAGGWVSEQATRHVEVQAGRWAGGEFGWLGGQEGWRWGRGFRRVGGS